MELGWGYWRPVRPVHCDPRDRTGPGHPYGHRGPFPLTRVRLICLDCQTLRRCTSSCPHWSRRLAEGRIRAEAGVPFLPGGRGCVHYVRRAAPPVRTVEPEGPPNAHGSHFTPESVRTERLRGPASQGISWRPANFRAGWRYGTNPGGRMTGGWASCNPGSTGALWD